MLKGQDMVVLAALMGGDKAGETFAELSGHVGLSVSETHASVGRLRDSALVSGERRVLRRNVVEFLIHGLRYAFPFRSAGGISRGLATSYAAPVASGVFATTGMDPVWSMSSGSSFGPAFEPLYPTVPEVAVRDRGMYDRLAVLDMLRGGRLRERQYASKKLKEMLP